MLEPTYAINETYSRTMPLITAMDEPGVADLIVAEGVYGNQVEVVYQDTPQGRFPVSVYSFLG